MKVSVIMPCYNSSKTILASVNSVLKQSYDNIELIVVDDGSTDNTMKILKQIKDNRLIIYKQANKGPGNARNLGIKKSTGNYIMFCDSDDLLDVDIIYKLINSHSFEKFDVVLFRTLKVSNNDKVLVDNKLDSFTFTKNDKTKILDAIYNKFSSFNKLFGFDGVCGKIVKKDFILNNNIHFPDNILRFEDAYFCKCLYEKSNKIKYEDYVGYYYIQNSNSLCHKYNSNAINMYVDALETLRGKDNNPNFYVKVFTTITECEVLYFYNKKYKKSYFEYKREFLSMLELPAFKEAIKNVNSEFVPFHYRLEKKLLEKKLILLYTIMKKIYLKMKNSI